MAHVVQNLLIGGAELPQTPLKRARAHPECLGDLLDGGAFAADLLAEDPANVVGEVPRPALLLKRGFETWHKQSEQLGVVRDVRQRERRLVEDQQVERSIEPDFAAEVCTEHRLLSSTSRQLDTARPYRCARPPPRDPEDARKDDVNENRGRALVGQEPLEAKARLAAPDVDGDLLGTDKALVPRELRQALAE